MRGRVHELVGSRIESVLVDGALAYLEVTHRGTDDEACTLIVRVSEIEWLYPSEPDEESA